MLIKIKMKARLVFESNKLSKLQLNINQKQVIMCFKGKTFKLAVIVLKIIIISIRIL